VTKAGIAWLVDRTRRRLERMEAHRDRSFMRAMADYPIAQHVDAANRQHYELPPDFFALTLGPRRKYSCCLYPTGRENLEEAERAALEATAEHADLANGQRILELGCGWGSLTLYTAARFPGAEIVAVSNSKAQRGHIEAAARQQGLDNITVITADMNTFAPAGIFDRIVSIEMFEHMSNWRDLLQRARSWLAHDGCLFLHVFSHRSQPYRFDHTNDADWIARHFFTGGIMPSHGLIGEFPDIFSLERSWRWNGLHYHKTALHWLNNFDANEGKIVPILRNTYGREASLWLRRWRLFYLATAGLFGCNGGEEWGVSHYSLRPAN
jgi:cyclopropane-fatty-acyl-phospholipid synthase